MSADAVVYEHVFADWRETQGPPRETLREVRGIWLSLPDGVLQHVALVKDASSR